MKVLCAQQLANTVKTLRVEKGITVQQLSVLTGANIERIERQDFIPNAVQFEALSAILGFTIADVSVEKEKLAVVGMNKLFRMMIALRQQIILRKKHERNSL